jgi:predicted nuclease of predicted toxin-antitoxin system
VKLLLDVHIAKAALGALQKAAPQVHAEHISQWRGGAFLRTEDAEILAACHAEKRVLVTYDLATIPDLLRRWMAEDRPHSGVVFADENTVKPNAPGEVASAIASLAKDIGNADTTNLVRHLRPTR